MRTGWGAGQGHHTPRLGSDKRGWLGVFTCPAAIKRETLHREWSAMDWGPEARVRAGAWRSTTLICLGYTVGLAERSGLCGRALAKNNSHTLHQRKSPKKSSLDRNLAMTKVRLKQLIRTCLKGPTFYIYFDRLIKVWDILAWPCRKVSNFMLASDQIWSLKVVHFVFIMTVEI